MIGGGAVGAACARALAMAGARVTVVHPPALPGEAWRASAGMLAAQIEVGPQEPLFNLGIAGRAFYRREAPLLRESTGIDIALSQDGILQIAIREEQVEGFKAKVAWQRQQAQRADWLEPEELEEGWPWLRPGFGGFWAPEDGTLDPIALVEACLADASSRGGQLVEDRITGLWRDGDRLLGAIGEAGRHPADQVVIAAGAWSGRLGELPRPLSIEPVRGRMVATPWPEGARSATVYGDHCYLLRRGDELIAGATMEHAGFDDGPAPAAVAEFVSRLTTVYPAIAAAPVSREWAGFRPGTPDGLPIIGPEPRLPGLWYATGHGRNGILLAGITGELIAQGIGGEPIPEELRLVRPGRFWSW